MVEVGIGAGALVSRQTDRKLITLKESNTIAVDLTPILPGGENGGAKIFVLELLRCLAEWHPSTNFVLLTQAASHEELSALDRDNVRRVMLVGSAVGNTVRPSIRGATARLLPYLPELLRRIVARFAYSVNRALKRFGNGSILRELGADLLFCPFTAPTFFDRTVPTVCTIYDLQFKAYPKFFTSEDVAQRKKTFQDACRRATALAAISDYSRQSAIFYGKLPQEKIRTIYLRMAQRIVRPQEVGAPILDQLGLIEQRYLLYPANFWKHKNHEMLLTAFGMACAQGLPKDMKLVCTGAPGERQAWLHQATIGFGLEDRVVFPGYLPDSELAIIMANACGIIFPSLYEGFGLPVVEAMAAGVPVACSNITSLPEVASDAAVLFNPKLPAEMAQALLTLVMNQPMRNRCIEAGKVRAAEFSDSHRMAEEYWDLFKFAVATHKQRGWLSMRVA